MKFIFSFIFIIMSCHFAYSQSIENVNFTVNEDFINVNYDLKHEEADFLFDLELSNSILISIYRYLLLNELIIAIK
jgi:hypothetical protein